MMKILLVASVVFLNAYACHSQKGDQIVVSPKAKQAGEVHLTSVPIMAMEYELPERIEDVAIDTLNDCLTILLRGLSNNGKWLENKGHALRYSNVEKRVLWSRKTNYLVEHIESIGEVTLHSKEGECYRLDNQTGEILWEAENSLIFMDVKRGIGMGYPLGSGKEAKNSLVGYDLNTGSPVWKREISREFGWDDILYLNDSTILIVASGLHSVSLNSGVGWDYHAVSGEKDYTAAAVGTGLGIVAGLLTGAYSVSTGHDLLRDLVSNALVDSQCIYFASKEYLVKLDVVGNVIWKTMLPADLTSKSSITVSGTDLLMVNSGSAYMGNRRLDHGTPFVASFKTSTGEKNFLVPTTEKDEVILAHRFRSDRFLIVTKDRVSKYSTTDGSIVVDQQVDITDRGELRFLVGDQVYLERDSMFHRLTSSDSSKYYLYTQNRKVVVLNSQLDLEGELDALDLWVHYADWNGLRLVAKDDRTIVLDSNGRPVAGLSASSNSYVLGNNLYSVKDSSFLEIDLAGVRSTSP